jgi:hypothetical protein
VNTAKTFSVNALGLDGENLILGLSKILITSSFSGLVNSKMQPEGNLSGLFLDGLIQFPRFHAVQLRNIAVENNFFVPQRDDSLFDRLQCQFVSHRYSDLLGIADFVK